MSVCETITQNGATISSVATRIITLPGLQVTSTSIITSACPSLIGNITLGLCTPSISTSLIIIPGSIQTVTSVITSVITEPPTFSTTCSANPIVLSSSTSITSPTTSISPSTSSIPSLKDSPSTTSTPATTQAQPTTAPVANPGNTKAGFSTITQYSTRLVTSTNAAGLVTTLISDNGTTPSLNQGSGQNNPSSAPTGPIVGGVVGGIIGIILLVLFVRLLRKNGHCGGNVEESFDDAVWDPAHQSPFSQPSTLGRCNSNEKENLKEGRASSGLDRSTSGATALSNGSASYRKRWSSNASGGDAYVNYGNGSGMNQEKGMISPDGDRLSTTSIYSSEIPDQSYRPNDYTQPTPQQQNYTTSNSEGHEESINRSSIDQSTMDHSMAYSEGMTAATTGSSSYHTNNGFLPPPPSIPHNRALGRCDSTMSVVEPTQSFGVLRIANVTEED